MTAPPMPKLADRLALDMTPPEDVDAEWAAVVKAWASLAGYKYVNQVARNIPTTHGNALIPRGLLSDGASGPAPDFCPDAWWAHDRLYLCPTVSRDGRSITLTRRQCDEVYRNKTSRVWLGTYAPLAYVALRLRGGKPWRAYRRMEQIHGCDGVIAIHTMPHQYMWQFPTNRIADAVLCW